MIFHCCDPRRLEVLAAAARPTPSSSSRCSTARAPPGAPRQQTLFVRLLRPGLRAHAGQPAHHRRRAHCAASTSSGAPPADALPPQAEPGLVDTVDDLARTLVVRTDSSGDFSTYTLSIVANSGSRRSAGRLRSAAVVDRLLVQGRVPGRLRLRPAVALPARHRRTSPTIDYLAKDYQGFRRLMLDRLSLLVPGLDRALAGRPRRHAGRTAGLRRRQPLLPPGRDRQRGLSRHRAAARLGAPPRAPRRLLHARGLQRARLRALRRRRPGRRPRPGHAAADPQRPASRRRSRRAARSCATPSRPAPRCSRPRTTPCSTSA